ncbi:MAG: FAD:protein FMN transferase [Isosphaeraceae bacterium]
MGSEFKILLYTLDADSARLASRAAFDRIGRLDKVLSDYEPDSELSRLGDASGGPAVETSEDLFDLLRRSQEISDRTEGAFDITVGPVVRLWRRSRRTGKMPDADLLAAARSRVGYKKMSLEAKTRSVRLAVRGMKLDPGGIAKGHAAHEAIRVLKRRGIDRALVAADGDIVVSGAPPNDPEGWTIAVGPVASRDARPVRALKLRDAAISTSGDLERFVEIDGKRYSHIVDPRSGLGIVRRGSVTVIADDGASADALCTACFVLGPDRALPLIESTPKTAAFFALVTDSGLRLVESRRFKGYPVVRP